MTSYVSSDPRSGSRSDAEEIRDLIDGMFKSFAAHDPSAVEAALDPDCTVWDVFVPDLIMGKENRKAFHEADRDQSAARGKLTISMSNPVIDVWGEIGLARYVLTFDYAPPNSVSGRVRISTVLRRKGNHWRIVHHHEGMVPGGIPPTSD